MSTRTSSFGRGLSAVARLDFADVMRSRWIVFCGAVYAVLAALFVLVGTRESTVLGFTGMGRALLSFCHVLVLVLPLLALTATGQVVTRAREEGALELFLAFPIRRSAYLLGVTAVRYLVLLAPLAVLMLLMGFVGATVFHQPVPWGFLARALGLSAALLWAFVGLGLAVSTTVRDQARGMIGVLLLWALAVALLDLGLLAMMLTWNLNPRAVFVVAAANPVQCARMALLAGVDPDLNALGPVGFYLANRIGTPGLVALGLGWPAFVGFAGLGVALRRFCTRDLV